MCRDIPRKSDQLSKLDHWFIAVWTLSSFGAQLILYSVELTTSVASDVNRLDLLSTLDCEVGSCNIVSTNAIALESRQLDWARRVQTLNLPFDRLGETTRSEMQREDGLHVRAHALSRYPSLRILLFPLIWLFGVLGFNCSCSQLLSSRRTSQLSAARSEFHNHLD